MITLITGVPGSGKTLYAVWLLGKIAKDRRVLVDGIRDLAIEHVEIDEPWLRQWHVNAQAHDLIVVDEAQRIYPPTTASQKPTPDVEQLHVHRHMGVDFIIITQHPQRISKTVRDLVGRHVHVRNLFGLKRAVLYEWDHCHNPSSLKDAVKTQWPYPRDVFKLYTSAEVHTKKQAVIPKALFLLPIGAVLFVVLAVKVYHKAQDGFGVEPVKHVESVAVASPAIAARPADSAKSSEWRVAGRYSVDGASYVVLVAPDSRLRTAPLNGFSGQGVSLTGEADGKTVAGWTGVQVGKTEQIGGVK
ncbi:zonular occludens toxin domain-containing protein [Burkholderia sp. MSMB1589WGS]|uniref:zonular occludens toxin domain-containing protein n=1 Tax=Burkholderia sp. MSMB1589WGS TaxID=1636425 RepID=UPI0007B9577E|nr:zonular occludens toxin domain-containing protein [Burkholderia sp. MSMB1589WGS]